MIGYSDSQQGRQLPDLDLGALQDLRARWRGWRAARACGCSCSTAAAGRWAAAAAPASRRSWPSPRGTVNGRIRITEQGEVVANKYADPELARQSLETLTAGVVLASLRSAADGRGHRAARAGDGRAVASGSMTAYRALVYETPGFVDYFYGATPISEIADLNIGSRPTSRQATPQHRRPARHPLGVLLVAERAPCCRAGTASARRCETAGVPTRSAGRAARELAVLLLGARQHGDGAGQGRHGHRRPLRGPGRGPGAGRARCSARSAPSGSAPSRPCWRSPASRRCWTRTRTWPPSIRSRLPYIDPLNHLQIELIRRRRRGRRRRGGARRAST